jgi:hypothetical protein
LSGTRRDSVYRRFGEREGIRSVGAVCNGQVCIARTAQSLARELSPQGIHVAHFVIDGGIRSAGRGDDPNKPDALLDPDAIALTYLNILRQPRSAWTWEIELRPWVERF